MRKDEYRGIRHKYNPFVYSLVYHAAKAFFTLNFKDIKIHGLENLKGLDDFPVIYPPPHKSHLDYFIIPALLYKEGFKTPVLIAGDNLFVPLIGWIYRRLKAAEFKRKAGKEEFDRSINYINKLLENKEHILFFPEFKKDEKGNIKTGRSYTGEFNEFSPLLVKFMKEGNYLMPIAVSYSKIPEDNSFHRLGTNKSRNKFVFQDIPYIITQPLTNKRGEYQINFGEPILIEKNPRRKSLLKEIHKRVGDLYTVFPSSLFAQAIRQIGHNDISYTVLEEKIYEIQNKLKENGAIISDSCDNINNILDGAKNVFHHCKRNFVTFERNKVVVKNFPIVKYYSSTIERLVI